MVNYFIRRLLLMIPTFIGITFLCFTVTRFVPGGPVEQAILRYQQAMSQSGEGGAGGSSSNINDNGQISEEMMQRLKEIYGFDKPFYHAYVIWLWKVIHFDLGKSDTHSRPVWDLIVEKFPISVIFGLTGFLLSYGICIPLGVWKAVKHGSIEDTSSSVLVFIAYSIPGWTAGVLLLMLLGGGSFLNVVPLGNSESSVVTQENNPILSKYLVKGAPISCLPEEVIQQYDQFKNAQDREHTFVTENHEAFKHVTDKSKIAPLTQGKHDDLSFFGRFLDIVWHMLLPVFCYVLGSFASMTVLMKNSLMENLGQDYIRTAFAKGLSEKTVVFKHALRNSLIPLAIGLGHMFSFILAGSYLIEKVFNINGFGLLGYESLIARDYPVTLGILVISSMLSLLGNILSDLILCFIDPRIRFS